MIKKDQFSRTKKFYLKLKISFHPNFNGLTFKTPIFRYFKAPQSLTLLPDTRKRQTRVYSREKALNSRRPWQPLLGALFVQIKFNNTRLSNFQISSNLHGSFALFLVRLRSFEEITDIYRLKVFFSRGWGWEILKSF